MKEVKFKLRDIGGRALMISSTECPFKLKDNKNTFRVNSFQCRTCDAYVGEVKDKQSILCEGDEYFCKVQKQKIFLTEKSNIEYKKIKLRKPIR